jgi:excinuclease ABC subunit C
MEDAISRAIGNAPRRPGVYVWKDGSGRMLYVGKAGSLRDRLRSYLKPTDPKTGKLVDSARALDTIVTGSEAEALILEDALVKQNQPRYNVHLRDDKRYPYIRITAKEAVPRIQVVRRVIADGSRYFGPYTDPQAVRRVIRMVGRHFGLRRCNKPLDRVRRPCINHDMGECSAPCMVLPKAEYAERVRRAGRFLAGDNRQLIRELKSGIRELSSGLEYEKAAELRDTLMAIRSLSERQDLSSSRLPDMDIVGYSISGGRAVATQMKVRDRRVVALLHHPLAGEYSDSPSESLRAFIKQHYSTPDLTPGLIVTSAQPGDKDLLEAVLTKAKGARVRVQAAVRGQKRKLADMAVENGIHHLEQERLKREAPDPLDLLSRIFRLGRRPVRIEGYDISNLGGRHTVGGMVAFSEGRPDKGGYRMFRIRGAAQDDAANMEEMLERRFRHVEWRLPDLVVLDGGPQQLNAAKGRIPEGVAVVALAKRLEEVYVPGRSRPVRLDGANPALRLLQAVRDEAHRFGKRYHTLRRAKGFLS